MAPRTPPGPAGWRQIGLLTLLALIVILLVARECSFDPDAPAAQDLSMSFGLERVPPV